MSPATARWRNVSSSFGRARASTRSRSSGGMVELPVVISAKSPGAGARAGCLLRRESCGAPWLESYSHFGILSGKSRTGHSTDVSSGSLPCRARMPARGGITRRGNSWTPWIPGNPGNPQWQVGWLTIRTIGSRRGNSGQLSHGKGRCDLRLNQAGGHNFLESCQPPEPLSKWKSQES